MHAMPSKTEMEAFRRGQEARRRGTPLNANPFHRSGLDEFWMFGWVSVEVKERPCQRGRKSN